MFLTDYPTTSEVLKELGCSRAKLAQLRRDDQTFPRGKRIGAERIYPAAAVQAWLKAQVCSEDAGAPYSDQADSRK